MLLYFTTVIAIAAVVMVCTAMAGDNGNVEFLAQFGWEVDEKYIEKESFTMPVEFDEVYENYNELQKKAGLDLEPYKGKKAVRYTYIVKNYPEATDTAVRANVICVGGKPIAGDVMTVELDGFMNPLNFLSDKD